MIGCSEKKKKKKKKAPLPPMPVESGCPSGESVHPSRGHRSWTRQHEGIYIDPKRDVVASSETRETLCYLKKNEITDVAYVGAALNLCILQRGNGIVALAERGYR